MPVPQVENPKAAPQRQAMFQKKVSTGGKVNGLVHDTSIRSEGFLWAFLGFTKVENVCLEKQILRTGNNKISHHDRTHDGTQC